MRITLVLFVVLLASCFTPVNESWCDALHPCTKPLVCSGFQCVRPSTTTQGGGRVDGGTGGGLAGGTGGGASGGGSTGGGSNAGGGLPTGGGFVPSCQMTCAGCCINNNCVPIENQSPQLCGELGATCISCGISASCSFGICLITIDAGVPTGVVGGPCQSGAECGSSFQKFCIPEFSQGQPTGFVGGYCQFCDNIPCPSDGTCVQAESQQGPIQICVKTCGNGITCRTGYLCEMNVCTPM
jgi:hypothetical protein